MDQAIGGGVDVQGLAEIDRRREPIAPESAIDGPIITRDHPQRDLRLIAEQRVPKLPIARPAHFHDHAGLRALHVGHVRAINPRMPGPNSVFALGIDGGAGCHAFTLLE
jgi:hypothetical protein